MANTNNPHSFLFEKDEHGGVPHLKRYKTASNTTIAPGDPLVISSGYLKLAGATSTGIFGFALEAVTGVTGTRDSVAIIPALSSYVFSAQHGGTLNVTHGYVGKRCGISSSTGVFALNLAATTSVLQVLGLKPGSAWGTYCQLMLAVVRSTYEGSIR